MITTRDTEYFSSKKATATYQRLTDSYWKILLVCILLSTTAMAVLSTVPPSTTSMLATFASFLLFVSVITAAFIAIITLMLSFVFGDPSSLYRWSQFIAWIPVFFLDLAFIQLVVGMVLWFADRYAWQFATVVALWSGCLFLVTMGIAGWIAVRTDSFNFSGTR
ncbi:hypothetical protein CGGC5_v005948 [Colletotrichum fructicola Nara gc5]|uniref:Uncharacterized protein n=1 Tax=Colletotrichum fructicola (strain Nara gc5) TaxID=1213859 RepID=A0A7J6JFC7_COLFN|nr:hypothetical protein CGGC5_v005948 [Colletotrichum fructicola Nara gc5]KAF4881170.1 hypothetical protein CGCFRS4_v015825 [Colletotrichum fructicola]